ncbi:MAG: M48 family metallopeptidase [Actinomycetota bacterium]
MAEPIVEVRRSQRRRRTVTAYRENGKVIVCVPGAFSRDEEKRWVATMLQRLEAQEARRRPTDERLLSRARRLSTRYLDGRATPASVRWSSDQQSRWASCTPADGTIRISDRLQGVPPWVLDYVLVHELAHLLIAEHTDEFWALVNRYPRSHRARGFLDGMVYAAGLSPADGDAM